MESSAEPLLGVNTRPALVVVSGLRLKGANLTGPDGPSLYPIAIADVAVLGDAGRLAAAANAVREAVLRRDPKQIARRVRTRSASSFLEEIGCISSSMHDQLLLLKPKSGLHGGVSIQLG